MEDIKLWTPNKICLNCKYAKFAVNFCKYFSVDIKNPYLTCSRWEKRERYKPKRKTS